MALGEVPGAYAVAVREEGAIEGDSGVVGREVETESTLAAGDEVRLERGLTRGERTKIWIGVAKRVARVHPIAVGRTTHRRVFVAVLVAVLVGALTLRARDLAVVLVVAR